MRPVLLLAISFPSSIFLLPSSSSSSSPTHWSSDSSLDNKLGATPHEHLNGLNRLTAADVKKLGRGHGSVTGGNGGSGGVPDNNGGGGNVPAGGAVVPVIIAGAANNNHHQNNHRGAAACNFSNINIYWRGLATFFTTAATLASLRKMYMFT